MLKNVFQIATKVCRNYPSSELLVQKRLAGHSKWANIKHDKGLKDQERSALFTKLGRMMKVAIQEGGTDDPAKNQKLQQVIDQCRRANMPTATVQSVIKSCKVDKSQCKSYVLEINGPGSCIILLEVFTDNLHAFRQTMVSVLKKHKSKFSEGARHLFEEKGIIDTDIPQDLKGKTQEEILEVVTDHAIESGAEDVKIIEDNYLEFTCGPSNLKSVQEGLEKFKYNMESASVEYIPLKAQVLGEDDLETCAKLMGKLGTMQEVIRISDNVA